jgi:hypothetical protein
MKQGGEMKWEIRENTIWERVRVKNLDQANLAGPAVPNILTNTFRAGRQEMRRE